MPVFTCRRCVPALRGRGASGFTLLRRPGLAGLLAVLAGRGEEPPRQRAAGPPAVPVSRPVVRQVSDWDEFTGRFVATAEVQVRARASGYLTGIHFRDGQTVEAGDVLFTIDPRPYQAAVQAAQAAVAENRATLDVARTELDRAAELLRTQAAAQAVVDQRAAAVRRGEAQLALAQANLLRAQLDLEYTVVRAPFAGRIDRHYVSVGNLVAGDATVLSNLVAGTVNLFGCDRNKAAGGVGRTDGYDATAAPVISVHTAKASVLAAR